MSECIQKLPHEECGSRDALQVFQHEDGKIDGYCFACDTYIPDPYGTGETRKKTSGAKRNGISVVQGLGVATVTQRKLHKLTLEHFGCKVGLSQEDGETPVELYFPLEKEGKVTGYKMRSLAGKDFYALGDCKKVEPVFLSKAIEAGSKRLYITEGEIDALTVWQVLMAKQKGTKWAGNGVSVCSLPQGASSAKQLSRVSAKIRQHFKEICLVFDNDEPGEKAVKDALIVFPAAKVVKLSCKDANECLMEGNVKALENALLFNAKDQKKTTARPIEEYLDKATKPVKRGLDFPWRGLTDATRGLRFGETYYFGAGVKMGKTDLANALVAHFAVKQGLKVFIANLEEANVKTTQKVVGKVAGKVFHDPNKPFDTGAFKEAAEKVKGRVFFSDAYQNVSWEELRQDIIAVVHNHDVKLVLIDPITNLTNGITASDVDAMLRGIAQEMALLARDLDISIMIFCHCKAPVAGRSHERGGKVLSSQFTGSRAMARSCNYMIGLEGNKEPSLETKEQNTRKLVILEDREYGTSAEIMLYWDENTHLFREI